MPIELNLASTVWKTLVGEILTPLDLKNIDKAIYNSFLGDPEVPVEDAVAMAAGDPYALYRILSVQRLACAPPEVAAELFDSIFGGELL